MDKYSVLDIINVTEREVASTVGVTKEVSTFSFAEFVISVYENIQYRF
ncbi:hypothetical protein FACS1894211_16210 [Clostridia bacterium]|nr:hypothetical protein FACS1894211_16210 [Clostridia bacterium]